VTWPRRRTTEPWQQQPTVRLSGWSPVLIVFSHPAQCLARSRSGMMTSREPPHRFRGSETKDTLRCRIPIPHDPRVIAYQDRIRRPGKDPAAEIGRQ
jgi:hypothetical protein